MASFISKLTGGFTSSAAIVDGTLILSLPDAVSPVVWRMELGHVRASAIEVRAQDDGIFMLTLKTPKGDVNDIAPYASRARALAALMAVSRAMERAQGQILRAAHDGTAEGGAARAVQVRPQEGFRPIHLLTGIAGLALVVILIGLLSSMGPQAPSISPASGTAGSGSAAGSVPAGEAVSADDFLNQR